jgi:uncharacterized protein (TIGR03435 family)
MPDPTRTGAAIAKYLAGALLAATLLTQHQSVAQTSRPAFEVVSIKPSTRGGGPYTRLLPGRFLTTYSSLQDLIGFAYGVRSDQIEGAAPWMISEHYDIEATAAGHTAATQMVGAMLQSLLEDRFKLAVHRETKQLPVYALTVMTNGLKLQPMKEGSCVPFSPDSPRPPVCGYPRYGPKGSNWTMDGEGVSMVALAESLSRLQLGRTVLDRTGLAGYYQVHMQWTADPQGPGTLPNTDAPPAPNDQAEPSLFTALREQLGLKIESAKGPVGVLVIDHVQRPTEN